MYNMLNEQSNDRKRFPGAVMKTQTQEKVARIGCIFNIFIILNTSKTMTEEEKRQLLSPKKVLKIKTHAVMQTSNPRYTDDKSKIFIAYQTSPTDGKTRVNKFASNVLGISCTSILNSVFRGSM